jgi:DNA-binding NarL/FixJ family response regulator
MAITKRRVVIADDSPMYLELLAIVVGEVKELELVGRAANGREAIDLAVERDADVVLLDIDMPVLNGIAAAAQIRRIRPQTDVFVHSALRVDEHRRRGEQLGLAVYDKLELLRTIDLLARKAAPSRNHRVGSSTALAPLRAHER